MGGTDYVSAINVHIMPKRFPRPSQVGRRHMRTRLYGPPETRGNPRTDQTLEQIKRLWTNTLAYFRAKWRLLFILFYLGYQSIAWLRAEKKGIGSLCPAGYCRTELQLDLPQVDQKVVLKIGCVICKCLEEIS